MNDDEVDADGLPADRAGELLRRCGVVEEAPPPHVWEAILTAVRGEVVHEDGNDDEDDTVRSLTRARDARDRRSGRSGGASGFRWPLLLAGAAAGALITWAGLELTGIDGDGAGDEGGVVLASGPLAPLAAAAPAGDAEVVEVDGHHRLRVALEDAPDAGDGYLEVWLLRPDVSGMVTLGVLEGDSGEFLLPPGLDLGEYPVVDISLEHVDGDPGHGGDSLVRGEVG